MQLKIANKEHSLPCEDVLGMIVPQVDLWRSAYGNTFRLFVVRFQ
jgi:hypothetical protein